MARRVAPVAESRVPLSRERVLETALAIADKTGIDSLTMRRLAQELGVEAMSLYYYVPNKNAILAGIADMVVSEIELPAGGSDWRAAIRKSAISFHNVLSRHPWATTLMMSPATYRLARVRYLDAVLRCLREAGFSAEITYHAYHALDSHIMGSTLWEAGYSSVSDDDADAAMAFFRELPIDQYPYFAEHLDQHVRKLVRGSGFEFGLDLILDSLEKIRKRSARPKRRER